MILPKIRDKRFITIRRGGTLEDEDHHLLAVWAAACADHVRHYFEDARPGDSRPRSAVEAARAWAVGALTVRQALDAAGAAQDAAREVKTQTEAARLAALSAGQAAAAVHVAAHELGAAAYAIRAVMAASPTDTREQARRAECQWQREQLPERIRALVIEDQHLRNDICWLVFDADGPGAGVENTTHPVNAAERVKSCKIP